MQRTKNNFVFLVPIFTLGSILNVTIGQDCSQRLMPQVFGASENITFLTADYDTSSSVAIGGYVTDIKGV